MRKVTIIGGGLAGLISSIQLIRAGIPCTVIEKKSYPFHRVCGEYISNEAVPFLKRAGLYPKEIKLPQIKFLEFSSLSGRVCKIPLDLGGFGASRFFFDHFLYTIAQAEGVGFEVNTEVTALNYQSGAFELSTAHGKAHTDVVIGCFGKRSRIDVQQHRAFIRERSPYVGVKYHVVTDRPEDVISIHNFPGGYCGVCRVEDGLTNLCYLVHRDQVRRYGDIAEMERTVLFRNPILAKILSQSTFLFDKPEVINEISFANKAPVENHVLMAGDAAGMITPVCGNGMAMAIHSGKMVADLVKRYCAGSIDRQTLEHRYERMWNSEFKTRLLFGRYVQRLTGLESFSNFGVSLGLYAKPLAALIVKRTHGAPF